MFPKAGTYLGVAFVANIRLGWKGLLGSAAQQLLNQLLLNQPAAAEPAAVGQPATKEKKFCQSLKQKQSSLCWSRGNFDYNMDKLQLKGQNLGPLL